MRLSVPGHGCYCPIQKYGIYISTENLNPSNHWPGTTWELYAKDRFLVGAGASYNAGAQGGANTVALSVAQMPSHNHLVFTRAYYGTKGSNPPVPTANAGSVTFAENVYTGNVGSGSAHENRPPYIAVYFWRRTK